MILKLSVLAASVLQVVGAAYLSIGTFEDTDRALQVFIQPAGWAFSIWGLIYLLSFIYAVYQIIPKYDNKILKLTRVPALVGFISSVAWLYFAGMNNWTVFITVFILFAIAISFIFVINAPDSTNKKEELFSKQILFPYAAWSGIASWLNVQTLLNDQYIITGETINLISNGILFICISAFTLYCFKKTKYSAWYGGVIVWACSGIIFENLNDGMLIFALLSGLLALITLVLYLKNKSK